MDILSANFAEGKPRMMIKKIVLSNFASFYGEHGLQLEEGLNFVESLVGLVWVPRNNQLTPAFILEAL